MQKFKVSDLIPHSQNEFFFDDMEGQKWKEFLESVRTSGVIEPPVVANEGVIVSGHQRIRACKELGIDEIFCEVRIYDDPDKMTKDLIETNIRQRGTINGSELKMGRIIKALERVYGVKNGRPEKLPQLAEVKSQSDIAKELGMSVDKMNRLKKLADLPDEYQDMIESGTISVNTASTVISKLSEEDQLALLQKLPVTHKLTQSQVQQYIDQIKGLECEKQELQKEVVDVVKAAKGAANASDDSADYLQKIKELEEEKEKTRLYYEKWNAERNKDRGISPEDAKAETEQEVAKVKADYRRLVDSMQKQLNDYEDAEPEVVTVEVIPDDYEELKAELERLKNSKPDDHIARVLTIDETPEERARYYFTSMQNSTGGFLSEMEGFALQKEFCLPLPADKKAFIAENLRTIINRCEEIITFIKDCSSKKEVA